MNEPGEIRDYRGNIFTPFPRPARVVSLVPSITELLFDLGLDETEIVGRTRFCVHPAGKVESVHSVGGTKDFKMQRIALLTPDIIIANVDENRREEVERLEQIFPEGCVYVTHPNTFDEALNMIRDLGSLFSASDRAANIIAELTDLRSRIAERPPVRVLYMIWMKPFMSVAPGTFIHDMLHQTGHQNCITTEWIEERDFGSDGKARYPELTLEEIVDLHPEQILLSSEPYPFKEKHVRYLRRQLSKIDADFAQNVTIKCVDGEAYSWYGSRMLHSMRAFAGE